MNYGTYVGINKTYWELISDAYNALNGTDIVLSGEFYSVVSVTPIDTPLGYYGVGYVTVVIEAQVGAPLTGQISLTYRRISIQRMAAKHPLCERGTNEYFEIAAPQTMPDPFDSHSILPALNAELLTNFEASDIQFQYGSWNGTYGHVLLNADANSPLYYGYATLYVGAIPQAGLALLSDNFPNRTMPVDTIVQNFPYDPTTKFNRLNYWGVDPIFNALNAANPGKIGNAYSYQHTLQFFSMAAGGLTDFMVIPNPGSTVYKAGMAIKIKVQRVDLVELNKAYLPYATEVHNVPGVGDVGVFVYKTAKPHVFLKEFMEDWAWKHKFSQRPLDWDYDVKLTKAAGVIAITPITSVIFHGSLYIRIADL